MGGPRKNKTNAVLASSSGNANNTGNAMEDLMTEMNSKLSSLVEEVRNLGSALKAEKQKNEQLRETVQNQADEIAELRQEINKRELHARSWSIRVVNMPIAAG
jgi:chromosome segregation ATPase